MNNPISLTFENYLERDSRLDFWSVHGLGGGSHTTDDWVKMVLSIEFEISLPDYLHEMFKRAQACMVYGCHHYPLFTLGIEELFRFSESALREALKEAGVTGNIEKKPYANLIIYAADNGFLTQAVAKQWDASRSLRNSTSHKKSHLLLGPNDALNHLEMTKHLTEALFLKCRAIVDAG